MQTRLQPTPPRRRLVTPIGIDQRGLSTVEYVIILVLVAAMAIGTWAAFGQRVACALGFARDAMPGAGEEGGERVASVCPKGGSDSTAEQGQAVPNEPSAATAEEPKKVKRIR